MMAEEPTWQMTIAEAQALDAELLAAIRPFRQLFTIKEELAARAQACHQRLGNTDELIAAAEATLAEKKAAIEAMEGLEAMARERLEVDVPRWQAECEEVRVATTAEIMRLRQEEQTARRAHGIAQQECEEMEARKVELQGQVRSLNQIVQATEERARHAEQQLALIRQAAQDLQVASEERG